MQWSTVDEAVSWVVKSLCILLYHQRIGQKSPCSRRNDLPVSETCTTLPVASEARDIAVVPKMLSQGLAGGSEGQGFMARWNLAHKEEQRDAPSLGQPSQHTCAHPPQLRGRIPFQMRSMLYSTLVNEGDAYMCYLCWHKSIINKYKVHSLTICLWC